MKKLDAGFGRNVTWIAGISLAAVMGFVLSGLLIMRSAHSDSPSTISVGNSQNRTQALSGAGNQRYDQIIDQYNTKGAASANMNGGSFIPVIKTDPNKFPSSPANVVEQKPDFAQTPTTSQYMNNAGQLNNQQQVAQRVPEPQGLEDLLKEMGDVWKPTPPVAIGGRVDDRAQQQPQAAAQPSAEAIGSRQEQKRIIATANSIAPSVLDTAIDTDKPSRVIASIVQGPFSGGRASGTAQRNGETVEMKFTSLTHQGKTYTINALAVDQDTMRSAMEGDVDRKIIQRYGIPILTALVRGYGEALATQNTTVSTSPFGSTTQVYGPASDKQVIARAIGSGSQAASQQLVRDAGSVQPAVSIPQGIPFGLFFLEDVTEK